MENPPPGRGGDEKGPPPDLPKHDQVVSQGTVRGFGRFESDAGGDTWTYSGISKMGYIFPVKDNGKTHIAAIYISGTILTPGNISIEGLQTYEKWLRHFKEGQRSGRGGGIPEPSVNGPHPDQASTSSRQRGEGEPNPFVVGQANYQKFLDVMLGCTDVNVARRK